VSGVFDVSLVNRYLAHKQHLLPSSYLDDVVQVTRDIVALHATSATSPYLSLWARMAVFRREMLEEVLYERRELAKVLCMRVTVHAVPSDEVPMFIQAHRAYIAKRTPPRFRGEGLLVHAGLCQEAEALSLLEDVQRRVLGVLSAEGPATAQEISEVLPEFSARIRHDVGKPYEGEFSIGSRLLNDMTAQGQIIRARPRGTWRSNLYEYAVLQDWLPDVDLGSVGTQQARSEIVRRYLKGFGPAAFDDVRWWTGFSKRDTQQALKPLGADLTEVAISGLGDDFLMLRDDARRMDGFSPSPTPYVFFLPSLDPYIMGYRDRRRFLDQDHSKKVFDRAGNALPTVWAGGRLVGAWDQSQADGRVIYGLFERVSPTERGLLDGQAQRLGELLGDTFIKPAFFHTPFTRDLSRKAQ
jgi:hypothetical protein